MLCQFTVSNFCCIKDELTLDMQAANINEHSQTVLIEDDGEQFLPLAVIYGPNGGGKSTVLRALYALKRKIMMPICSATCPNKDCIIFSSPVNIEPFGFSKEMTKKPTEFELFFRVSGYEYRYKATIWKNRIMFESLHRKKVAKDIQSRYSMVFERKGSDNITLKGSLKKYDISGISDTLSLISYFGITHGRNSIIRDLIIWFETSLDYLDLGNPIEDASIIFAKGEGKKLLLQMLEEMDISISDYRLIKSGDNTKVYTTHQIGSERYELPFSAESSGTKKIFNILPRIADSILFGRTLLIDELDAKIHPQLLKYIIELYSNPKKNHKKAQLIFTSHDLYTMSRDYLRRDEIWFVSQNQEQAAGMYSLVEIKERNDASYGKRYMEGHYGADPYLKRIIEWEEK